jgi:hypothetical protein
MEHSEEGLKINVFVTNNYSNPMKLDWKYTFLLEDDKA